MASYQYVYVMKGLRKDFPGGKEVLKNVFLSFLPGAKIGVVGLNGAGKSTLMKIMAGMDNEFDGEAWAAEGAKVGYLPQEPVFDGRRTVMEEMHLGAEDVLTLQKKLDDLASRLGHLSGTELDSAMKEYDRLSLDFELAGGYEYEIKIRQILAGLELEEGLFNAKTSALSGGQLSRN